MKLLKP